MCIWQKPLLLILLKKISLVQIDRRISHEKVIFKFDPIVISIYDVCL